MYEFNEVASVPNSTTISFVFPMLHAYTQTGNVQVIRVPRFSTFTLNAGASLTTQAWNGSTGGVLTFESNGNTVIDGVINANGLGFKGGKVDNGSEGAGSPYVTLFASTDSLQGGEKCEGIGGSQVAYDGLGGRYGRGAGTNGDGGGNSHNAGGGGGGFISTTNSNSLQTNVNGGKNGTTTSSTMTLFTANGGTMGHPGKITLVPPNPYSGSINLPVSLKKFFGEMMKEAIEVKWMIDAETNNQYFTIEKSTDGFLFYDIGKVNGRRNATVEHTYHYLDEVPLAGDNYYRLSQTDFNGTKAVLGTMRIRFNNKLQGLAIVYSSPNPVNDFLMIEYNSNKSQVVEMQMHNPMGQLIRSAKVAAEKGINSFYFGDQSELKCGVYFVQLKSGDEQSLPLKVIKN